MPASIAANSRSRRSACAELASLRDEPAPNGHVHSDAAEPERSRLRTASALPDDEGRGRRRKRVPSAAPHEGNLDDLAQPAACSDVVMPAPGAAATPTRRKRRRGRGGAAGEEPPDDTEATPPPPSSDADVAAQMQGTPIELGKGLRVHDLGRVEYHNPKFHDRSTIYPVGYHVRSCALTTGIRPEVELLLYLIMAGVAQIELRRAGEQTAADDEWRGCANRVPPPH